MSTAPKRYSKLSALQMFDICKYLHETVGTPSVSMSEIRKNRTGYYQYADPIVHIDYNNGMMIMADRTYIAYSDIFGTVTYVYMSWGHVVETRGQFGGAKLPLMSDRACARQIFDAVHSMMMGGKTYWCLGRILHILKGERRLNAEAV